MTAVALNEETEAINGNNDDHSPSPTVTALSQGYTSSGGLIHAALITRDLAKLSESTDNSTRNGKEALLLKTPGCHGVVSAMQNLLHLTNVEVYKRISACDNDNVSLDASAAGAKVLAQLPDGWTMDYTSEGLVYFRDTNGERTRWTLPWGKDIKHLAVKTSKHELALEEAAKYPLPADE